MCKNREEDYSLEAYSPSCLRLFRSCPYVWGREYNDGLRRSVQGTPDTPAWNGSSFHKLAEMTIAAWKSGVDPELPPMTVMVREIYDKWKTNVFKWITLNGDVGIEQDLRTIVAGYPIRAIIDYYEYYEGVALALDWKTGRGMLSEEEMRCDIQMIMQTLVLMDKFPDASEYRVGHYYTRFDNPVTVEWSSSDRERLESHVVAFIEPLVESHTSKIYPPTPGAYCDWCAYHAECPVMRNLTFAPARPPETEEEAAQIAELAVLHASRAGDLKELARIYYERTERPIFISGLKGCYREKRRKSADTERAISSANEELFRRMIPFLKLDVGVRSKIWKDNEMIAFLTENKLIREDVGTEFSFKKDKGGDDDD